MTLDLSLINVVTLTIQALLKNLHQRKLIAYDLWYFSGYVKVESDSSTILSQAISPSRHSYHLFESSYGFKIICFLLVKGPYKSAAYSPTFPLMYILQNPLEKVFITSAGIAADRSFKPPSSTMYHHFHILSGKSYALPQASAWRLSALSFCHQISPLLFSSHVFFSLLRWLRLQSADTPNAACSTRLQLANGNLVMYTAMSKLTCVLRPWARPLMHSFWICKFPDIPP